MEVDNRAIYLYDYEKGYYYKGTMQLIRGGKADEDQR